MFFKKQSKFATRVCTFALVGSVMFSNVSLIPTFARNTKTDTVKMSALGKYATDLTALARAGRLSANANYEREVNQLIQALASGDSRQPVILDDKGENQKFIVELLASRIAKGDVPANLKGRHVLELELDSMFSNVKGKAEAAQMIADLTAELAASRNDTILFVNELTNFVGSAQINNALTEALLQGKVSIIGGSSKAAYAERIENAAEFAAMFQTIAVGSANFGSVNDSQKSLAENEEFRGDIVSPDIRAMLEKDPSGSKRIDVILQSKDADNAALRSFMAEHNVRLQDRIGSSNTLVVNMPLKAAEALAQSGLVNYMSPDREMTMSGHVEDTTGATTVRSQTANGTRAAYTLDGTGIGVAIVDSGIYAAHKNFKTSSGASRIVANVNFTNATLTDTEDVYGHGTHVAGLAAGSSTVSSGAYRGIAPNANVISVKVLNNQGIGQTSWILNGLNWILANRTTYNIRVVNLSLGGFAIDTYTNDPVCRKVKELSDAGIVVIAASGNLGKNTNGSKAYGRIHSPGNSPYAITVGASNSLGTTGRGDDVMTSFTSRGPTRSFYTDAQNVKHFDNLIKPDLVAPGNRVVSSRAINNFMATQNPSLIDLVLSLLGTTTDGMMYMSGTSMSAPVVSGAAALLLQVNPNLTPNMVKAILQYTAQPIAGSNMFEQGAGELNIEGAVRLAKSLNTGVNFSTLAKGTSTVPAGWIAPTASSTIGGGNIVWSQMITTNYGYITGQNLISQYQSVYTPGSSSTTVSSIPTESFR